MVDEWRDGDLVPRTAWASAPHYMSRHLSSEPIFYLDVFCVVAKILPPPPRFADYLRAFDLWTWLALLGLLQALLVLLLLTRILRPIRRHSLAKSIELGIYHLVGSLTGSCHFPEGFIPRFVVGSWFLGVMILQNFYSDCLLCTILSPQLPLVADNLHHLAFKSPFNELPVVSLNRSESYDYMMASKSQIARSLRNRAIIQPMRIQDSERWVYELIKNLTLGKVAIIRRRELAYSWRQRFHGQLPIENIYLSEKDTEFWPYVIAINLIKRGIDPRFMVKYNRFVTRARESGITNHAIETFIARTALYPDIRDGRDPMLSEFTPVGMNTAQDVGLMLAFGTLVAISILLLEWQKSRRKEAPRELIPNQLTRRLSPALIAIADSMIKLHQDNDIGRF